MSNAVTQIPAAPSAHPLRAFGYGKRDSVMQTSIQLMIEGIANDPIQKIAVVRFSGVLDDLPKIHATIRLVTRASQTQAEVHTNLKQQMKAILEEAIRGLDRLSDI